MSENNTISMMDIGKTLFIIGALLGSWAVGYATGLDEAGVEKTLSRPEVVKFTAPARARIDEAIRSLEIAREKLSAEVDGNAASSDAR